MEFDMIFNLLKDVQTTLPPHYWWFFCVAGIVWKTLHGLYKWKLADEVDAKRFFRQTGKDGLILIAAGMPAFAYWIIGKAGYTEALPWLYSASLSISFFYFCYTVAEIITLAKKLEPRIFTVSKRFDKNYKKILKEANKHNIKIDQKGYTSEDKMYSPNGQTLTIKNNALGGVERQVYALYDDETHGVTYKKWSDVFPVGYNTPYPNAYPGHKGVDSGYKGDKVVALFSGYARRVIKSVIDARGLCVEIDTCGNWVRYMHLEEIFINEGDWVNAGDVIGVVGNTSTLDIGYHLHVDVWLTSTQSYVDPYPYLNGERDLYDCKEAQKDDDGDDSNDYKPDQGKTYYLNLFNTWNGIGGVGRVRLYKTGRCKEVIAQIRVHIYGQKNESGHIGMSYVITDVYDEHTVQIHSEDAGIGYVYLGKKPQGYTITEDPYFKLFGYRR